MMKRRALLKLMLNLAVCTFVILSVQSYGFNVVRRTFSQYHIENLHNLTLNCSEAELEGREGDAKCRSLSLVAAVSDVGKAEASMDEVDGESYGHFNHDSYQQKEDGTLIAQSDVQLAFNQSVEVLQKTNEDIVRMGWKLVHENELYSLFKRRGIDNEGNKGNGPVEYMMKGFVKDVSPRLFLHTQTNKALRKAWDNTMKDMETDEHNPNSLDKYVVEGNEYSEDTLYYRTKWPWPLKDRDYTLARGVHFLTGNPEDKGKDAVVFVSKASTSGPNVPRKDGVIRVDNYWCHSTYFASTFGNTDENTSITFKKGKKRKNKDKEKMKNQLNQIETDSPVSIVPASESLNPHMRRSMENLFSRRIFEFRNTIPKLNSIKVNMPLLGNGSTRLRREDLYHDSRAPMPIDLPGTRFVTIFCDDSKVPLPAKIVDMISTQAEKVVPESMRSLHSAAVAEQERIKCLK